MSWTVCLPAAQQAQIAITLIVFVLAVLWGVLKYEGKRQ